MQQVRRSDYKRRFYEELEHVFYHFPKYHIKIVFGDLNAKVERENIFKPTIGNESLHEESNDNGVRIVKLNIYIYIHTLQITFLDIYE
jgi:exonuclease III